jgi:CHASE2 domain-containing sensor protein
MQVALYALALFCGIATVRATTIMDRARVKDRSFAFSIISGLSLLATFGLVGLGFLIYEWWIPIVATLAMSLLVGIVVIRATHGFFYRAVPVTGLVTIAICAYGWLKWAGA